MIAFVRGDTKRFKWRIESKDRETGEVTHWEPGANDKVYFTCKRSHESAIAIQKVYPGTISFNEEDGYFRTEFKPKDTNHLAFGDYIYDIEVILGADDPDDSIVRTVAQGEITLQKEVTFARDEV